VQFLAERVPLEQIYRLFPPGETRAIPDYQWSAWDICESLAQKLHFVTRKGTFDTYRAANALLRDALAGVVVLAFDPPHGRADSQGSETVRVFMKREQTTEQQTKPTEQAEQTPTNPNPESTTNPQQPTKPKGRRFGL